ncbi:methionine ABC transporter permease [Paraburkholderia sp. BCC1886]|uniref:methionine ABC transporter permease n=1 Tax=Paraburkholderia sp. BCC1886 TaxID=2562670 RepID=UPI0011828635|nr:methionine ABC transporter permease [Paraburkholderia sp. BCC1886]
MSNLLLEKFWDALLETFTMVAVSGAIALLIGVPLAVLLVVTSKGGIHTAPRVYRVLSTVIDAIRATPFIIMMVLLIPLTRWLLGSAIGVFAAIVPLTISITPYFARITEISLRDVGGGLIEAAEAMGCGRWHIVRHVLLPEALPGIVSAMTITIVALFNTSAMAGALGAGGLGDLAIRYGYERYDPLIMLYVVAILFALVTGSQGFGDWAVRYLRRRR